MRMPVLLPGANVPPEATVRALTVPSPFRIPPLLTVTEPAVPCTSKGPPLLTVVELEEIDPPEATSRVPTFTAVAPV